MNVSPVITKDYEKNTLGELGKNKPNSNPIQTQFKPNSNPISQRVKLMRSVYLQRIMKNNADMGYEKTNPNKPNLSRRSLWRSRIKTNDSQPRRISVPRLGLQKIYVVISS